jgi:anti-anti-sigma factor
MSELAWQRVTEADGVHTVTLHGELDFSASPRLAAEIESAVGEAQAVVLDITDVTFIDSAGVRLLDRLAEVYAPRGALRVVVDDDGPVRFTLRLCGFPAELLETSRDAAVKAVAPHR